MKLIISIVISLISIQAILSSNTVLRKAANTSCPNSCQGILV